MTFENLSQVRSLNESDLRELLNTGEEIERVWAAWSLALKLSVGSIPDLVSAETTNPSSGLRRHLVVILSSYGELDILRTFAERDPVPEVRATACLHLLQTRSIDDPTLNIILLSILEKDTDKKVKANLLSNAVANKLPVPIEQLVDLASDSDTEVRTVALSVLKQQHSAKAAVEAGLIDKIKVETDQKLLQEIAGICADAGCRDRVMIAAKMRDLTTHFSLLNYFKNRKEKFDWQALEGYANLLDDYVGHDEFDFLLQLTSDNALPQMFIWLTEKMVGAIRKDDPGLRDDILEPWGGLGLCGMFGTLLGMNFPVPMTAQCRANLEEIRAYARSLIDDEDKTGREEFEVLSAETLYRLSRLIGDNQEH